MVMYAKIRRMFYREHLSINEIQRRTSLSRNTIKKWLKVPSDSAIKYRRAKKPGKLTLFESRLVLALEVDARRPKKDRRTALMLFKEILNEGYTGGYTIVCYFVRNWRNQGNQSKSAYVPLKFALGEAFQFDWRRVSRILCKRCYGQWIGIRSSNIMVNLLRAAFQFNRGMVHFWLMFINAR